MTVPLNLAMSDLREQTSMLSEIPVASIKLLLGFPPKLMQQFECSVEEAGIKSGDTIIAEADSSSAGAAAGASHQPTTKTESSTLKHVTEQANSSVVPLILRKVVPADNSCLFTSMGFVLGGIEFITYS